MTKHLIAAAAAVALCLTVSAEKAEARGFHFQSGGIHVDVGRPHGNYYRARTVGYGGAYGYNAYAGRRTSFYGGNHYGHGGGHGVWHNTGHYDYHAPSLRPHGNHFDYTPGHYDYHDTSHFDHH